VISGFGREVAEFWAIMQNNAKEKAFFFGFLNPENGTESLSRNVGKKLLQLTLLQFSG